MEAEAAASGESAAEKSWGYRHVSLLRDAAWLTGERARAYCTVLFAVTLALSVGWIATARHAVDRFGRPLGTDFISFWTASSIALHSAPARVYDVAVHHEAQIALFGKAASSYTAFFYPPIFLLVCLPFAALPYLAALAAWLGLTFWAFYRCLRRILPQPRMIIPLLAYPAVILNIGHGQNGFLSASLFGAAMLAMPERPLFAGLSLGCLIYKPHLLPMIPLALLAGRRWAAVFGAGLSATGLLLISFLSFGASTWRGFFAIAPLARHVLEQNIVGPAKMPSVFAAARLLGGSVEISYALQIVVALGIASAVSGAVARRPGAAGEVALMASGALLASPFLLDYDLTIMAFPLAWVLNRALEGGFLPWEKTVLAAGYTLPLFCRDVATLLGAQLGPPVLLAVFAVVLRRTMRTPRLSR